MPEHYLRYGRTDLRHLTGEEPHDELAALTDEALRCGFSCHVADRDRVRKAVTAALDAVEGERRYRVVTTKSCVEGICAVVVDYHPDADPAWLAAQHQAGLEEALRIL